MESEESYEAAWKADVFSHAAINLRLKLDGTTAIVDLVEGKVSTKTFESCEKEINPELKKILSGSRAIVESGRLIRIRFCYIQALLIQEEFRNLVDDLRIDLKKLPRLSCRSTYPVLKVINSRLRKKLPDYQGGDDPDIQHFKLISMETCVDVIGVLEDIQLLENQS